MSKKQPEKQEENRDKNGRFVKGQSGNPNGRPTKEHSVTDTVKAMMEADPSLKQELVEKVLSMALAGDIKAITLLWHYLDGQPTQRVESKDVTEEASEELKLLREILDKHEKASEPIPAEQQTN